MLYLSVRTTGRSVDEFLATMGTGVVLIWVMTYTVLDIAGLWMVFKKAGRPGWAAIIPFYNYYVMLKIVGRPGWWLILFFIPIVVIVIAIIVLHDLSKSFGKGVGFTIGLVLLSFIFVPILGFGAAQYRGPAARTSLGY